MKQTGVTDVPIVRDTLLFIRTDHTALSSTALAHLSRYILPPSPPASLESSQLCASFGFSQVPLPSALSLEHSIHPSLPDSDSLFNLLPPRCSGQRWSGSPTILGFLSAPRPVMNPSPACCSLTALQVPPGRGQLPTALPRPPRRGRGCRLSPSPAANDALNPARVMKSPSPPAQIMGQGGGSESF